MRHISLSLAALALAACGSGSVDPDARMPTPYPEESDGPTTSIESSQWSNPVTSTEVSEDAMDGEWTSTTISGDSAVQFADAEGNNQVAVICREGDEDQANSLTLRRYVAEDMDFGEDSSITVYTSAGSKQYVASSAPVDVTTSLGDYFASMIGSARGDIRIIVDDEMVIIPSDEAVRELVASCRPEMEYQGPQTDDESEEESE
ncbi:MAG: hypothetical protein RIB03_11110 [Henriciella sp.]|uniref:hypothetical protein n=1 Tax=Henriciella sp. TaxID=1968823 RepID=UPI0032EE4590